MHDRLRLHRASRVGASLLSSHDGQPREKARLKGENQLPKLIQDVTFHNGVEVPDTPEQTAA